MKKLSVMLFCSVFLCGAIDLENQMFLVITEVFSITLDIRTLSYFFTSTDVTNNATQAIAMGSNGINVTINDNTTTPNGTNYVYFYSLFAASDDTVQMIRSNNTIGEDCGIQDKIDLLCEDDRNSSGQIPTSGPVTIVSGDSIRTRVRQTDASIVNEVHNITFSAAVGSLTGKGNGNYGTLVYFSLDST